MKIQPKQWLRAIAAGCIGAITLNAVTLLFGTLQVGPALGIDFAPDTEIETLYMNLFWGSIWGLLFLLPLLEDALVIKGSILSLVPSLIDLAIVFPYIEGIGFWGIKLGALPPFTVLFFNGCWGISAGLFLRSFPKVPTPR